MMLRDFAPRLALARDQWIAYENARVEALRFAQDDVLRLERLVAHRDLQVIRALARCARPGARPARSTGVYLVERQRKLAEAQAALRRAVRRARDLERAR